MREVRNARKHSPFQTPEDVSEFIIDIIFAACEKRGVVPSVPLGNALFDLTERLLFEEAPIGEPFSETDIDFLTLEEGVRVRALLARYIRFLEAHHHILPIWKEKLTWFYAGLFEYLPDSAFTDINDDGQVDDDSIVFPEAHIYDLCESLPELIERTMATFFDQDVSDVRLFVSLREAFEANVCTASGVPLNASSTHPGKTILPTQSRIEEPTALVDLYLQSTPLQSFFYSPLPFAIPFPIRFEHTHVIGGTGHGKTQLLQFLIYHDLVRAREDERSVVVIDSQGDLIRTISHLGLFDDPAFADRLVLIDPNDIEHPVALNMFDFNRDRLSGYSAVDREKILNGTIELYEYFFDALLGAELTQRQGLIFRYLARLLIEIPDATIHTLMDLMQNGERYRPYMEKLSGTSRNFFATQFFERKFSETKKQILTRLWGVLSNTSLERMFSHSRNRVDMFDLMNQGKIVLINSAKELLGRDGTSIFGRFFISLISQATLQRTALPAHERRPTFVYIDEAHDYFDDNVSQLLNQARKYRVGLTFAHQNLGQLGAGLRSSVFSSTSIKLAGGVSAKDARVLCSELRCDPEFLLKQEKRSRNTEFACFVKNLTSHALTISVPIGFVEARPQLSANHYLEILEKNRKQYCETPISIDEAQFDDRHAKQTPQKSVSTPHTIAAEQQKQSKPPEIERTVIHKPKFAQTGQGGRQHRYLQHLVKQLGEERGFKATIEEPILEGAGRIDVTLIRKEIRIACEVSVTTTKDWELSGIEKCLAAGYSHVVLIGTSKRHVQRLSKFIKKNLGEYDQAEIAYLTAEELPEYLDSFGPPLTTEKTVRGYKVKIVQKGIDAKEAALRRNAISQILARSLRIK